MQSLKPVLPWIALVLGAWVILKEVSWLNRSGVAPVLMALGAAVCALAGSQLLRSGSGPQS